MRHFQESIWTARSFATRGACWLTTLALLSIGTPARALSVGQPAPQLTFTDIDGVAANSTRYSSWVQVLTVADRASSEKMSTWMNEVGIEVAKKHPDLRIAYLGFADMQMVPGFMRPVAEPILRHFNERSQAQQAELYSRAGVKMDPTRTVLHLVPDWDGTYLTALGVEDAALWRCWIVVDGKVVEAIDGDTSDGAARYLTAMDRASDAPSPTSAAQ